MANDQPQTDLAAAIESTVPYLRRYARALTGSQTIGDEIAGEALETVIDQPIDLKESPGVRLTLFRALHQVLKARNNVPSGREISPMEAKVNELLTQLPTNSREAILLHTIEGFAASDIAVIFDIPTSSVRQLIAQARIDIATRISGRVLIIEDESLIAMDLRALVGDLGHDVIGIAPNYQTAIDMGLAQKPDLILADIQLTDEKSGIDAVRKLIDELGEIPTIFVTAFPELFLSGNRPEPAFLITKPYVEDQVHAAVGQAMFFSSAAVLFEE